MHGINIRKIVRRCYWHRHPSHIRDPEYGSHSFASRIWHRHHHDRQRSHRSPWDSTDSDSDDQSLKWIPRDVPAGCLVVYVGAERRRYVIDYHYLSHPLFRALLQRSAEEYGFHHEGGLLIACEVALFEHLLRLIENHDTMTRYSDIEGVYVSACPTSDVLSRPLL